MPRRPCLGCGKPTDDSRCPTCTSQHNQQRDAVRGNRHARGYDARHDRIRAELLRDLIPGTPCPRCTKPMYPTQQLDAGHSIDLRLDPNARADRLEHARCNRGAANRA